MEQFYFVTACVMFAVVGLCIGSFLNVVVYRLPRGMNLAKPASHCPTCGHPLAWYDNIPLLSFLLLGGRCRYCGARITPRYFLLELFNCLLWLACAAVFARQSIWFALVCAAALSVLLAMAQCDIENMFIPDSLQAALLIAALCGVVLDPFVPWEEKFFGLLLAGGFFLLFYLLSFLLFGREGLGFGDVKLMACAGLLLGWRAACVSIALSVCLALLAVIVRRLFFCVKRPAAEKTFASFASLDTFNTFAEGTGAASGEFAFAPYLAAGVLFALFCGNTVAAWYESLFII